MFSHTAPMKKFRKLQCMSESSLCHIVPSCNSLIRPHVFTNRNYQSWQTVFTQYCIRERTALGFGSHSTEGWYLITSSYPMNGQNKLANNDWYVFKAEPRADAVVRQKTAPDSLCAPFSKIRLELFHTISLLKRNRLIFFFFSIDEVHFSGD